MTSSKDKRRHGSGVVGAAVVEVDASRYQFAAVDEFVGMVEDLRSKVALLNLLAVTFYPLTKP